MNAVMKACKRFEETINCLRPARVRRKQGDNRGASSIEIRIKDFPRQELTEGLRILKGLCHGGVLLENANRILKGISRRIAMTSDDNST